MARETGCYWVIINEGEEYEMAYYSKSSSKWQLIGLDGIFKEDIFYFISKDRVLTPQEIN